MSRFGGKFPIALIVIASGLLMLSALEVNANMDSIYPDQVYFFTAVCIYTGPWVAIFLFAATTVVGLAKVSREAPAPPHSMRNNIYSFASTLAISVLLYSLFAGVASRVQEISGMESAYPENPEWIPVYTLLILSILASLAPLYLPVFVKWAPSKFFLENPRNVEAELVGALGLGSRELRSGVGVHIDDPASPTDVSLDAALSDPSPGASDSPRDSLTRLALEQSDGHARLILKYYAQGYSQANLGFRFSLGFAVIAFTAILASGFSLWLHGANSAAVPTSITGAAGGISGTVSFLFFRRADKGRDLMMDLVDKLRSDREKELNVLRSLEQMERFEDISLRDVLRTAATLQFLGSSATLEQLAEFMKASGSERDDGSR